MKKNKIPNDTAPKKTGNSISESKTSSSPKPSGKSDSECSRIGKNRYPDTLKDDYVLPPMPDPHPDTVWFDAHPNRMTYIRRYIEVLDIVTLGKCDSVIVQLTKNGTYRYTALPDRLRFVAHNTYIKTEEVRARMLQDAAHRDATLQVEEGRVLEFPEMQNGISDELIDLDEALQSGWDLRRGDWGDSENWEFDEESWEFDEEDWEFDEEDWKV